MNSHTLAKELDRLKGEDTDTLVQEVARLKAENINLKRTLRDVRSEVTRYQKQYIELMESRSGGRAGCRHDYCERCGDRLPKDATHSCRSQLEASDATNTPPGKLSS